MVEVVTLAGFMGSLNVAVIAVVVVTEVAPRQGVTTVTVGGTASTAVVEKTTSTQ